MNTRPEGQNATLSNAIRMAGGVSIELPAITIESTFPEWLTKMPELSTMQQAIFISPNAVKYFFEKLTIAPKQIHWPESIHVIAIGESTASALRAYGVEKVQIPAIAESEYLLELNAMQNVLHQNILLVKGEEGRAEISTVLSTRGACVIPLSVYRRTLPNLSTAVFAPLWQNDAVDIILFTSQQAIHNIIALLGKDAYPWLCQKPCLVISERLANIAASLGLKNSIVARIERLMDALHDFKKGTPYVNKQ